MAYKALVPFIGAVGGVEVFFDRDAEISEAAAKEMNLAAKPELAVKK